MVEGRRKKIEWLDGRVVEIFFDDLFVFNLLDAIYFA